MDDIIEEVLLRIPVKSLVRCKSLSKNWQNFISHNSSFRQKYISRIKEQGYSATYLLGLFYCKDTVYPNVKDQVRFLSTRNTLPLHVPDETLRFTGHESLHIVGCSNGFLLSSVEQLYPMNYFICNPINKQWLPLPKPNTTSKFISHGFICHTSSPRLDRVDRYTVVRGIWYRNRFFDTYLTLEIFSSDSPSRTWKLFSCTLPFSFYLDPTFVSNAIIDEQGVIYLVSVVAKEPFSVAGLIIFDRTKEDQQHLQLTEFPTPEKRVYAPCYFGQSKGLLLHAQHERHLSQLKMWMLTIDEDVHGTRRVWSLIHKVSLDITMGSIPQSVQNLVVKAFHPTNPQLLFLCIGGNLVMCDVSNATFEVVSDFPGQYALTAHYFFPYTYGLIGRHLFLET